VALDLSELQNVGQTDCAPETVSADLSFFAFLQLVDLSGHRPAFLLIGIFEPRVFQVLFALIGLIIEIVGLPDSGTITNEIDSDFAVARGDNELKTLVVLGVEQRVPGESKEVVVGVEIVLDGVIAPATC
jgi:hypothetical protein